eukprot:4848064-Alexandrium_andersonii.AAC.1
MIGPVHQGAGGVAIPARPAGPDRGRPDQRRLRPDEVAAVLVHGPVVRVVPQEELLEVLVRQGDVAGARALGLGRHDGVHVV